MKELSDINWSTDNILRINNEGQQIVDVSDPIKLRKQIEPWLSALFQSEHLSLLVGTGLTSAISFMAGVESQGMGRLELDNPLSADIKSAADHSARIMNRGSANLEDDLRVAFELLRGLEILNDSRAGELKSELDTKLVAFIKAVLQTESSFREKLDNDEKSAKIALLYLKTFLLSFSSRATSRERLNLFTTNYDRFIELGCDEAGILTLDRFKGKLLPTFRTTKLDLDYHYNPPGIRGEPRYVEGVIRLSKIHGSIDWRFGNERIFRELLPFGASKEHPAIPTSASDQVVIYPNSSKDIETAFFPYAELFREFSTSVCRPNSVLVTYGYGFGDSHINRIISDMLTIPSTHLVIIAFEDEAERIRNFCEDKNESQLTLLLGNHLGNIEYLVDYYLPKSSIDRISIVMRGIKEKRGDINLDTIGNAANEAVDKFNPSEAL